uniref:Uncharacterized protein n=1 Tax=Arundo donax TaxID=35708 RepID=A0A0A9AJN3_ARUDO
MFHDSKMRNCVSFRVAF